MRIVILIAGTLLVVSCTASGTFECADSSQCGSDSNGEPGICEPQGACSFVDDTCGSGRRFDELAGGGLAGDCLVSCATRVDVGDRNVCLTRPDGTVECLGASGNGQLTDEAQQDGGQQFELSAVSAMQGASKLALGDHSCVIVGSQLSCFGQGGSGQLGDGLSQAGGTPVMPSGLSEVLDVAVGGQHTCAVESDGQVSCWGEGSQGQLGDGNQVDSSTPVSVRTETATLSNATLVASGNSFSCAIRTGGAVSCWGANGFGQLGTGDNQNRPNAVDVVSLAGNATAIAAGSNHVCALLDSGDVECWGDNSLLQVDPNASPTTINAASSVPLPTSTASAIAVGEDFSCALVAEGLACWGSNQLGQTGEGTAIGANVRIIDNLGAVAQMAAGAQNLCVTTTGGTVQCVGANGNGQLGIPSDGNGHATPSVLAFCQ